MPERTNVEELRRALAFISPDVERDVWVKVAGGLKHELGGEGLGIFLQWSAQGESFNEKDARSVWRSIKRASGAGRSATAGTIFYLAKQSGYERVGGIVDGKIANEERARIAAERDREIEAERARKAAAAQAARADALRRWEAASEVGTSSYLSRKGVGAHGCRFERDGTLLVPVRDAEGVLQSLQTILPEPRGDGAEKPFIKGGRVIGNMHTIGALVDAGWILLAEGYATAATVHEATGLPVAVAFHAGNLKPVAQGLRKRYPRARLLVCADDDRGTHARTGKNPGVDAARSVVDKVQRAHWVKPVGLIDDETDFNDLAARVGLDGVARQLMAVVEAGGGKAVSLEGADAQPLEAAAVDDASGVPSSRVLDSDGVAIVTAGPFTLDRTGVWYDSGKKDNSGKPLGAARMCGPLDVLALCRSRDGRGWSFLLKIVDLDGEAHEWLCPAPLLAGDGAELRRELADRGLWISPQRYLRDRLIEYLVERSGDVSARVRTTTSIGWFDGQFVLPDRTIARSDVQERAIYSLIGEATSPFRQSGTVAQWIEAIGSKCPGNSRLLLMVALGFAGPLARVADVPSGFIHLGGTSSAGKSSATDTGATVWGHPLEFRKTWRTTSNASEADAAALNDTVMFFDELGQVDAKDLGDAIYLLASGTGKGRMQRTGAARERLRWNVLMGSNGEIGLAQKLESIGQRRQAGQEVRFVEISADAGKGMGAFEELHGFDTPKDLAEHLAAAGKRYYGAVGLEWLRLLVTNREQVELVAMDKVRAVTERLVPAGSSGQVWRVARRFGCIGWAGELATHFGLTGWERGDAMRAVESLFNEWLETRGGTGLSEERDMLRAVRAFLEQHGESRFKWWHRADDDRAANTPYRCGFRRVVHQGRPVKSDADFGQEYGGDRMTEEQRLDSAIEYFVFTEAFRNEVCKGFDHQAVSELLLRNGFLDADPGRRQKKVRLPSYSGGPTWCYVIKPAIFTAEV